MFFGTKFKIKIRRLLLFKFLATVCRISIRKKIHPIPVTLQVSGAEYDGVNGVAPIPGNEIENKTAIFVTPATDAAVACAPPLASRTPLRVRTPPPPPSGAYFTAHHCECVRYHRRRQHIPSRNVSRAFPVRMSVRTAGAPTHRIVLFVCIQ